MIESLSKTCSQFLEETGGAPVIKHLKPEGEGYRKVKIRHKKALRQTAPIRQLFGIDCNQLNTSVVVNQSTKLESDLEPFYIFIPDGYSYLYNNRVKDSHVDYATLMSLDFNMDLGDHYKFDDLKHALRSNCEILFFGISHFFAIRQNLIIDYTKFIEE